MLLIKYDDPNWPKLDDFGGKVDISDKSIYDTILRELTEESNGVISSLSVDKCEQSYVYRSKYLSLLCKEDNNDYVSANFGDFEKTDNIRRTVDWYNYIEVKDELANRILYNKQLIEFLDSLSSSEGINKSD